MIKSGGGCCCVGLFLVLNLSRDKQKIGKISSCFRQKVLNKDNG